MGLNGLHEQLAVQLTLLYSLPCAVCRRAVFECRHVCELDLGCSGIGDALEDLAY